MTKPKVLLLISGKRKCGKDYLSARILSKIGTDLAEIIRISEPIKLQWAHEKSLDLNELLSDGPYKEKYRKEMIIWSDSVREKNPGYFCQAAIEKSTKSIVIVSDIRRKTDIKYFKDAQYNIKTIRINATDEVRKRRGWIFESGVDDVQSECDLDDFTEWDLIVDNSQNTAAEEDAILTKILNLFE